MIISCEICKKKFEIDSSLIPPNGRLLKCGSCDHEWFFTEQIIKKIIPEDDQMNRNQTDTESNNIPSFIEKEELEISPKIIKEEKLEISPNITKDNSKLDQFKKVETFKKKNNIKFFNILIVFIISIISLILIVDTFKKPISVIIPNIEHLLYNLHETLEDIKSFFIDLNR